MVPLLLSCHSVTVSHSMGLSARNNWVLHSWKMKRFVLPDRRTDMSYCCAVSELKCSVEQSGRVFCSLKMLSNTKFPMNTWVPLEHEWFHWYSVAVRWRYRKSYMYRKLKLLCICYLGACSRYYLCVRKLNNETAWIYSEMWIRFHWPRCYHLITTFAVSAQQHRRSTRLRAWNFRQIGKKKILPPAAAQIGLRTFYFFPEIKIYIRVHSLLVWNGVDETKGACALFICVRQFVHVSNAICDSTGSSNVLGVNEQHENNREAY